MKHFFSLLLLAFLLNPSVFSQPVYLNSLRSSFTFGGDAVLSKDVFYTGGGIGYTIKGRHFAGLKYLKGSDRTDSPFNLDHQQVELSFQTALLSQLKGDIYGVDAGVVASHNWFDNIDAFNHSLGLNLLISRKTAVGQQSLVVPQFELLYVPLSDTQVSINGFDSGQLLSKYFAGGLRSAFIYLPSFNKEIVLEGNLQYNFTDKDFNYGASLKVLL